MRLRSFLYPFTLKVCGELPGGCFLNLSREHYWGETAIAKYPVFRSRRDFYVLAAVEAYR